MSRVLPAVAAAVVAGTILVLVTRDPVPAPPRVDEHAVAGEAPGNTRGDAFDIAANSAPRPPVTPGREHVDAAPGLDDFAPEQRAAVREILERSRPDDTLRQTARARLAELEDDDLLRRLTLERELLATAAVVRCDVLAVGERTVTVRCLSSAPELQVEAGQRHVFALGTAHGQVELLARHGLAAIAEVREGRRQTLLAWRRPPMFAPQTICVLAGPPHDAASPPQAEPLTPGPQPAGAATGTLADFEPAYHAAAREILDGRSPFDFSPRGPVFDRLGAHARYALVRCKAERILFGAIAWRAQESLPDLDIGDGDVLEAIDTQDAVVEHYGLPRHDAPRGGELRTLLLCNVEPFGLGLYKRFLLLTSPPLVR